MYILNIKFNPTMLRKILDKLKQNNKNIHTGLTKS